MKRVIAILVIALMIAHQDIWYWNDETMVFGFMPIGLFYHVCISVAAALVWLLACQFAWPFEDHEDPETRLADHRGASLMNPGQIRLLMIVVYLLLLLVLGFVASRSFRGTKKDYLLASHSIGPFLLVDEPVWNDDDGFCAGRLNR